MRSMFRLRGVSKIKEHEAANMLVVAIDLAQSSIGGFVQPIELRLTGYAPRPSGTRQSVASYIEEYTGREVATVETLTAFR